MDMDWERRREIQDMRARSGRATRSYTDHMTGVSQGVFCLFRCFLAFAFFIAGVTFPMISDSQVPKELTEIPAHVSVNYTIEDVSYLIDSLAN